MRTGLYIDHRIYRFDHGSGSCIKTLIKIINNPTIYTKLILYLTNSTNVTLIKYIQNIKMML